MAVSQASTVPDRAKGNSKSCQSCQNTTIHLIWFTKKNDEVIVPKAESPRQNRANRAKNGPNGTLGMARLPLSGITL